MLTVIVRDNRADLLAELERDMKKRSLSDAERFAEDAFSPSIVLSVLDQQDLFGGGEKAIVLDQVSASTEGKEFLEREASRLGAASRAVYVLEASLPVALKKAFEKAEAKILLRAEAAKRKASPAIFALSDALIARDKKTLWLLYQDLARSAEPEEIAGTLIWQLKVILLLFRGETASVNPYVAGKSRSALSKYSEEEVRRLYFRLVGDYHRGHRGEGDLSVSLEQLILSL